MEIVLIRHGKPTSADNIKVNASGYGHWIRHYNHSDVSKMSRPITINKNYQSFYALSSDYKRAVHSANIYLSKNPSEVDSLFREMEIPRYKLPFTLSSWHWVYLCRLLWMLGIKGPFETFTTAKLRADTAAIKLIDVAKQHDKIVLFGHGYMNRYIRKALIKKGWQLKCKNNGFWGITSLTDNTISSKKVIA
jgi:broad specificity phosphatase PhoE